MTPLLIVFAVNALTSFFKRFVEPHFGRLGVHIVLFAAAAIGTAYYMFLQNLEGWDTFVSGTIAFVAASITLYELILSYFPMFKGVDKEVEG